MCGPCWSHTTGEATAELKLHWSPIPYTPILMLQLGVGWEKEWKCRTRTPTCNSVLPKIGHVSLET